MGMKPRKKPGLTLAPNQRFMYVRKHKASGKYQKETAAYRPQHTEDLGKAALYAFKTDAQGYWDRGDYTTQRVIVTVEEG